MSNKTPQELYTRVIRSTMYLKWHLYSQAPNCHELKPAGSATFCTREKTDADALLGSALQPKAPSDTATRSRALWEAVAPNPRAALNFSPRYTTRASGSHHKPTQHSSPATCCQNTCRSQPPRDSTKLPRWAPPGRFKEEIKVQQLFLCLVWNQGGQKYQGFCTTCSRSVGLAAPASGIAVLLTRL